MKKVNYSVVIFMASILPVSVFAGPPVNDVTSAASTPSLEKKLQDLSHLLETRNRMQQRFQNQLDRLAQEMSEIKGSVELFHHKIEQVESRQRDLYQQIEEQKKVKISPVINENSVLLGAESEQLAYQSAVDLVLVNKEYDQAIIAFEAFVSDYPKSNYVANAQYWLGQLLYKEKKREQSRAAFLIVIEQYPESNKRSDALFKIGIIDEYLGAIVSAKDFYHKVLNEYPDSAAAGLAEKRLKGL